MQKKRKIFNKRVQDFTIYSIHGRRVSADECVRATTVWVLILTDFGRCNLSETKKKKMLHIVWAAELLALFTIITRTGYLLVAQIRPHLTLFLSPVMCHFALISSLVLLSAQFYGLFPHFHSLYLSLCHFVEFFFLFFPPLPASLCRLTSSSRPACSLLSKARLGCFADPSSSRAMCQAGIKYNELQRVHWWRRRRSACLCAAENTSLED